MATGTSHFEKLVDSVTLIVGQGDDRRDPGEVEGRDFSTR